MTDRERWIVYPLLFLALGAALRDKLFDTTMSRRIVCQELVVVDEGKYPGGREDLVRIGAVESSPNEPRLGRIEVNGAIDAEGIFVRGVPVGAPVRAVFPGVSLQDLYRAWQQAAEQQQRRGAAPNAPPSTSNAPGRQPANAAPDDAGGAATTPPPSNEPSSNSAPSSPATPRDDPARSAE